MKRNIKLYALWYAAFPLVVVFVTLAVVLLLAMIGKESLCSLAAFLGMLCMVIVRRVVQAKKLKALFGSGDIETVCTFVRYAGANYPTSGLYMLAECFAGRYDSTIRHCTKMLKKHRYNRRLEYQWLSVLAFCYFDLDDAPKLAEVCRAFEERKAKESDPARIERTYAIFDFYRAYADADGEKCQSLLDAAQKSEMPIDIYRGAFLAARVAQCLQNDADTARAYYEQVAEGNHAIGFVRVAKQELQAMDAGQACAELPEILPDDTKPLPKCKEYVIWRVAGGFVYLIGVIVFFLAAVWLL